MKCQRSTNYADNTHTHTHTHTHTDTNKNTQTNNYVCYIMNHICSMLYVLITETILLRHIEGGRTL